MGQYSGIGVLDKTMTVLNAVAEQPCVLTELCERTGLPRATAHRLAVGLESYQLLVRDHAGVWRIGPGITKLAVSATDSIAEAASYVLPKLRKITEESIQVYRREGARRVCIASAEPHSGLRDTVPVGSVLSMSRGSGAKILAAWADPVTQHALIADAVYTEKHLAEIRRRGWAQSVAEREPGVASVSAPIRDKDGQVVAAISVSGPVDRIGRRPGSRWAHDIISAADAIARRL